MVSKSDLAAINELYQRSQQVRNWLGLFDQEPRITAFLVQAGEAEPPGDDTVVATSAMIPAEGIAYPPHMLAAIKQQLEARLAAINQELEGLGVEVEAA